MKKILITGGAGFIGSHVCDALLARGYDVTVYDNLDSQVHGGNAARQGARPAYLHPEVELIRGDVRDQQALAKAVSNADAVIHFAAKVGVGQSMYQMAEYIDVNNRGTALLLEILAAPEHREKERKLLVASSMSIYGEGAYMQEESIRTEVPLRSPEQLKKGLWNIMDAEGRTLVPVRTSEKKKPELASIYALSKWDQERMCLMAGEAYGFPVTALRFFNVYGERQSLSNPYTGVLAIFASRLKSGKAPLIYEDGYQQRDFVHVKDVAQACCLALESERARGEVFNIGSGDNYTILEVARRLSIVMNREDISPQVTQKYRVGDIRNCFADISKAKVLLGYEPAVVFSDGLRELALWLDTQPQSSRKHSDAAVLELEQRGLTV